MSATVLTFSKFPPLSDRALYLSHLKKAYGIERQNKLLAQPGDAKTPVYADLHITEPSFRDTLITYDGLTKNPDSFESVYDVWLQQNLKVNSVINFELLLKTLQRFSEQKPPPTILHFRDRVSPLRSNQPPIDEAKDAIIPGNWLHASLFNRQFDHTCWLGNLEHSRFTQCRFIENNFESDSLAHSTFDTCEFIGPSQFHQTDLAQTTFAGCVFHNIDFAQCKNFDQATFLSNCIFSKDCIFPNPECHPTTQTLTRETDAQAFAQMLLRTYHITGPSTESATPQRDFALGRTPYRLPDWRGDHQLELYHLNATSRKQNPDDFPLEWKPEHEQTIQSLSKRICESRRGSSLIRYEPLFMGTHITHDRTSSVKEFDLHQTALIAAKVDRVPFATSNLSDSDFAFTEFRGCQFTGTNLRRSRGYQTLFEDCSFLEDEKSSFTMFDQTDLADMHFRMCTFHDIDFRKCKHFNRATFADGCILYDDCIVTEAQLATIKASVHPVFLGNVTVVNAQGETHRIKPTSNVNSRTVTHHNGNVSQLTQSGEKTQDAIDAQAHNEAMPRFERKRAIQDGLKNGSIASLDGARLKRHKPQEPRLG